MTPSLLQLKLISNVGNVKIFLIHVNLNKGRLKAALQTESVSSRLDEESSSCRGMHIFDQANQDQ